MKYLLLMFLVSCANGLRFKNDTVVVLEGEYKDCIGVVRDNDIESQFFNLYVECPKTQFSIKTFIHVPVEYCKVRTVRDNPTK